MLALRVAHCPAVRHFAAEIRSSGSTRVSKRFMRQSRCGPFVRPVIPTVPMT